MSPNKRRIKKKRGKKGRIPHERYDTHDAARGARVRPVLVRVAVEACFRPVLIFSMQRADRDGHGDHGLQHGLRIAFSRRWTQHGRKSCGLRDRKRHVRFPSIGDDLENAESFAQQARCSAIWFSSRDLTNSLSYGTYRLSPSMTVNEIITELY